MHQLKKRSIEPYRERHRVQQAGGTAIALGPRFANHRKGKKKSCTPVSANRLRLCDLPRHGAVAQASKGSHDEVGLQPETLGLQQNVRVGMSADRVISFQQTSSLQDTGHNGSGHLRARGETAKLTATLIFCRISKAHNF